MENFISEKAKIGKNVKFGNFVSVYDAVEIGDNCIIDSYSEVGVSNGLEKGPLIIGKNAKIRSHSIIYAGSLIGDSLTTAHFSTIRENNKIGNGFQLGINGLVQPDCTIGEYVRINSNVMITHNSKIGNFVWIFANVSFASDPQPPSESELKGPQIEDYAVICTGAIVFPGVHVGKGSIVAAGCVLTQDLPDNMMAKGIPGKVVGPTSQIKLRGTNTSAYPWRTHFHRGYPKEIVENWKKEI